MAEKRVLKKTLNIPINQVEGDLEVRIALDGGAVADAWSVGTMFRGFENMLVGRHYLDGLVLTSRICGMCNMAHQSAAALALDNVAGADVPGRAKRLRNVILMLENIQSDVRHAFLLFAADFANPGLRDVPLFQEAIDRYEPLKGRTAVETLRETRTLLQALAILAGQWPHSACVVPGGLASIPTSATLVQCRQLLADYRRWYERRVLGCSVERWAQVRSLADLESWIEEKADHRDGEVGFFTRFCRQARVDRLGRGHGNLVSFGSLDLPPDGMFRAGDGRTRLVSAGFARGGRVEPFDAGKVTEDVSHSRFAGDGARHPFDGETRPGAYADKEEKYSLAKAPRYDGMPAETGPLAERVVSGDPLFSDWVRREGPHVLNRELARLTRTAVLLPTLEAWLTEAIADDREALYRNPGEPSSGRGAGLIEAARGALGHWMVVDNGRIARYQIITPTAWNAAPRDSRGIRGPWEEALVGTPVRDPDNPLEVGFVIRSFDACMVCCVHAYRGSREVGRASV